MRNGLLTSVFVAALTLAAPVAQAGIQVDPPEQRSPVLRVQPQQQPQAPAQTIIILTPETAMSYPAPFPGGCFNCSTLRSNSDNIARGLGRSHAFSQRFYYQVQPDRTLLLVQ